MLKAVLGIDVGKRILDVVLMFDKKTLPRRFDNSPKGFKLLAGWLASLRISQVHACLEATGIYGEAIAEFLYEKGHRVSVVNPLRIKGYAKSDLQRNKTDTISVGLEEKSGLLGAAGPYLVDDKGEKYFVVGTDSANFITSSFVRRGRPVEIPAKTSLTSRFVFSGSGEVKKFRLEANTIDWPRGTRIRIEGLNVRP